MNRRLNPLSPCISLAFASLLLLGSACGDDEGHSDGDAGLDAGDDTPCEGADCPDTPCTGAGCADAGACSPGETGCACRSNDTCDVEGDLCAEGVCVAANCTRGEKDCLCRDGQCDAGLFCRNGQVCIDNSGYDGGPCRDDGSCEAGNACDPWLGVCVHCDAGTQGCACDEGDVCRYGLTCDGSRTCVLPGRFVPDEPRCYTPCLEDLVDETGARRICDAEHLLPGCIDGRECRTGSCLADGEEAPTCTTDSECPAHQACIQSRCYSNCEGDSDCPAGMGCHLKVCRVPCAADAPEAERCPERMYCETLDGETGYCGSHSSPGPVPQTHVRADLTTVPTRLELSNVAVSGQVELRLRAALSEEITIRKLSHTVYFRDGKTETISASGESASACEGAKCPLWWLELRGDGDATSDRELVTRVSASCNKGDTACTLFVANGAGVDATRWTGELELSGPGINTQRVQLSYVSRPDGRWEGAMYYFGTFGDQNLAAWMADRSDGNIERVDNGLLRRWHAYRKGRLNGGWDEFRAVLTATRSGSWAWNSTKEACRVNTGGGACYLFDDGTGGDGTRTYVSTLSEAPIPSGAAELPIVINLWIPDATKPTELSGRIDTLGSLHYPANPAIRLTLGADAANDSVCDNDGVKTDCVNGVSTLDAHIFTGGRFVQIPNAMGAVGNCPSGFASDTFPWLLPGFTRSAVEAGGLRYRHECRQEALPFDPMGDDAIKAHNRAMAGANPVPDGVGRSRHLQLIDGALINQEELFVLFKEQFDPFLSSTDPDAAFSAYGYMILRRQATDLETGDANDNNVPDAYEGNDLSMVDTSASQLSVSCKPGLLPDDAAPVEERVKILIDGEDPQAAVAPVAADRVHYVCHDTGVIDGGAEQASGNAIPCPPGSNVTFFVVDDPGVTSTLLGHTCNLDVEQLNLDDLYNIEGQASTDDGTFDPNNDIFDAGDDTAVVFRGGSCLEVVKAWARNGTYGTVLDPVWRCDRAAIPAPDETGYAPSAQVAFQNQGLLCDDRRALSANKQFFVPSQGTPPWFVPLSDEIPEAFRYRTRFQSGRGQAVGFAPEICIENSNQAPYCYDPGQIEEVRDRVDCLLALYHDSAAYGRLQTLAAGTDPDTSTALAPDDWRRDVLTSLHRYLKKNFKVDYITVPTLSAPLQEPGFEHLNAELLITLGDESLTAAFASRFDLAGASGAPFEGSKFEPDGIDLTGIAGFEMHSLYQAAQYYQEVLDRFYFMGPVMWSAMQRGDTESANVFVTPNTVTTYFDKVVRASTQKARAWSEIAKRYQGFNRPDLARAVVQRAYVSTYLESVTLAQLISRVVVLSTVQNRPQLLVSVENAMRRYRMAMLDMATIHGDITDDVTYFGFEPDYVPFPALDVNSSLTPFQVMLSTAQSKMEFAATREQIALASNRSFKVDQATFQAELTNIRNTYENQLGDVCGTMVTRDGRIVPAIRKYAHLNDDAALLGEPCGFFGNGEIFNAYLNLDIAVSQQQSALDAFDKTVALIGVEQEHAESQCENILDISEHVFEERGDFYDLQQQTRDANLTRARIARGIQRATGLITMALCETMMGLTPIETSSTCPGSVAVAAYVATRVARHEYDTVLAEEDIKSLQKKIDTLQQSTARWQQDEQCEAVKIRGREAMRRLRLDMAQNLLDGLRAEFRTRQAVAEVVRLHEQGLRLQDQQDEAGQLAIDLEAARNDPNVRIYRNDAVINADVAFEDALKAAYRATRVFEYYTSQSYPGLEKLFLTRMVSAGDYNLENYLIELEDAYYQFEESFGRPDTRVAILSLRDDIMRVPYADESSRTLSQGERIDIMRARLKDTGLLDRKGYLTLPFNTRLSDLSPLTRNHKIAYVEADVIGSSVGDNVGRIYLRQLGTGTVLDLDAEKYYFRLPARTAVINPIFNGNRGVFDPAVYESQRLRDRPLVNSNWELVINQRDEAANQDLDLQSLSDIRLYVYYQDFTAL